MAAVFWIDQSGLGVVDEGEIQIPVNRVAVIQAGSHGGLCQVAVDLDMDRFQKYLRVEPTDCIICLEKVGKHVMFRGLEEFR